MVTWAQVTELGHFSDACHAKHTNINSLVLQFPAQEVCFSEMWLDFWPHRRYLTTHIFWQLWKRHILILDLYFFVRGEDAARHQPALLCVWYLGMENIWYWLDDFEWIEYGTEVRSSVSMPRALVQPSLEICLGHVVLQLVWSTSPAGVLAMLLWYPAGFVLLIVPQSSTDTQWKLSKD